MTDASNAPVRRPREEFYTGDVKIEQKPVISTREDLRSEVILAPEDVLKKDYADQLAFNEEPVTIRVERSSEKFAPRVVDVWCNGKGAEVWMNGRWVETRAIPIGMEVTTKRKYVEILYRSKTDTIATDSGKIDEHSEKNDIQRHTSARAPLSIIRDDNPKGVAWATALLRSAY